MAPGLLLALAMGSGPAWDILKSIFPKLSVEGRMAENARTERDSIRSAADTMLRQDASKSRMNQDIMQALMPALSKLQGKMAMGDIRNNVMSQLNDVTTRTGSLPPHLASSQSVSEFLQMLS